MPTLSRVYRSALLCCVFAAQLSCGGETADDNNSTKPPTATPPADAAEFYERLATITQREICRQLFQCDVTNSAELIVSFGRHADEAACAKSALMRRLVTEDGFTADDVASLAAGRIKYDAAKAAECLQNIEAQLRGVDGCDVSDMIKDGVDPASCDQVFTGQVPEGGDCIAAADCASPDATCQDADLCQGKCVSSTASQTCGDGPACADDELCVYADNGDISCQAKVALGQPCDDYEACLGDAVCDSGGTSDELVGATCKAPGSAGAGQGCDTSDVCAADLFCNSDGKCDSITLGSAGADCGLAQGQSPCKPGLVCELDPDMLGGKCVPLKSAGDACGSEFECELSLHCSGDTLKCAPRLADGASCSSYLDCESFNCNDNGKCAPEEQEMMCPQ